VGRFVQQNEMAMARSTRKLSPLTVSRTTAAGMYPDGDGLYLHVSKSGAKSWVYRFMIDRKARAMGLGSLKAISLSDARVRAGEARKLCADKIDPIAMRDADRVQARVDAAKSISFKECAQAYIDAHKAGWKNEKHQLQWGATLERFAYPTIGTLPVAAVDTGLVMKVLEPIWNLKTETASRLRGRIESILGWAAVRGYRIGDNPARWRDHLDKLLPAPSKVTKVIHHAALPFDDMGDFITALKMQEGTAARALEFLILTAARTGEVIGARWPELSFQERAWTIPAGRMKSGREHRVPLCDRAIAILEDLRAGVSGNSEFVFPGGRPKKPLSNMAMLALLRRMGHADLTSHGFRSAFKDWASERTSFANEISEAALAHVIKDKSEAAYRRGDLFDKRRALMDAWAVYCQTAKPQQA
jgi:integrase